MRAARMMWYAGTVLTALAMLAASATTIAANVLADNLGATRPNITTPAILSGLQSGKSLGQTLQSLGLSASEAKQARRTADRQAKDADKRVKDADKRAKAEDDKHKDAKHKSKSVASEKSPGNR